MRPKDAQGDPLRFVYHDFWGETKLRRGIPLRLIFADTKHHKEEVHQLVVWDADADKERHVVLRESDFASGRDLYLIWSNQHGAWWRPSKDGYTPRVKEAGRFTWDRATAIVRDANLSWNGNGPPDEIMVRETDMRLSPFRGGKDSTT